MKIRKNPNAELREQIESALKANDNFCPCRTEKTPDTRCMCKEFRDFIASGKSGFCHCQLYEVTQEL